MRSEISVIQQAINGIPHIHFTGSCLQWHVQTGNPLWLPIQGSLFETVEYALIAAGIAANVTSINKVRECGKSIDHRVIYNLDPNN